LQVDDVDARDRPIRDRLAFGECDLHPAALELGPVPVGDRLGEAELARVERTRGVEVPDAVPDARQSARPGSSSRFFSSRRNSAAFAPSTARWSQVRVIAISGRATKPPSATTGFSSIAPTARIAACGGVWGAGEISAPPIPPVAIVNEPPP